MTSEHAIVSIKYLSFRNEKMDVFVSDPLKNFKILLLTFLAKSAMLDVTHKVKNVEKQNEKTDYQPYYASWA